MDQLGDLPRLGESDGAVARVQRPRDELRRRCVGAGGGVQEGNVLGRPRSAVVVHDRELFAGEGMSQLPWIGDGGRRGHETRTRAMVLRYPEQAH